MLCSLCSRFSPSRKLSSIFRSERGRGSRMRPREGKKQCWPAFAEFAHTSLYFGAPFLCVFLAYPAPGEGRDGREWKQRGGSLYGLPRCFFFPSSPPPHLTKRALAAVFPYAHVSPPFSSNRQFFLIKNCHLKLGKRARVTARHEKYWKLIQLTPW